jgi:hypothetical protein
MAGYTTGSGESSIDLLATMAEWYTQHLARKPRADGRQLAIVRPRAARL